MFNKDLERLVRTMHRQKLPADYIRYYLIETYQITDIIVDQVFELVGVGKEKVKFSSKNLSKQLGGKDDKNKAPRKSRGFY